MFVNLTSALCKIKFTFSGVAFAFVYVYLSSDPLSRAQSVTELGEGFPPRIFYIKTEASRCFVSRTWKSISVHEGMDPQLSIRISQWNMAGLGTRPVLARTSFALICHLKGSSVQCMLDRHNPENRGPRSLSSNFSNIEGQRELCPQWNTVISAHSLVKWPLIFARTRQCKIWQKKKNEWGFSFQSRNLEISSLNTTQMV